MRQVEISTHAWMLVKIRQKTGCKSSGSGSYHRINAQQTIVFLSITIIITQWSSFLEKYFPQLGFMEHYFQQMWTVLQKKKTVRNISHIFICFESVYSTIFLELLFKILLFIYSFYLILTVLGLRCCTGFSLVVVSRDYTRVVVCGFSLLWILLLQSTVSRLQ